MSRVSRKEAVFYDAFETSAAKILEATQLYVRLVGEWPATDLVDQMKAIEHDHDKIAGGIIDELNRSFITPFDREDILALAHGLDSVVDAIEDVAASFVAYDVESVEPAAAQMAAYALEEAKTLSELFNQFKDFKHSHNIVELGRKIHDVEDQADVTYRAALGKLFAERGDAIHTIKWKSLFDKMEAVADSYKEVADVALGVVAKNA